MKFYSRRTLGIPIIIIALLGYQKECQGQETEPVLVIHAGAGTIKKGLLSDSLEMRIRTSLQLALDSGYAVLHRGGSAQEGITKAIVILEDSPLFNAGKGSVMNLKGTHELDASIMIGSNRDAGAVSGVTSTKNPILGAISVMENSPHVMLSGLGADQFCREEGLEQVKNSYFTTERIKSRWDKSRTNLDSVLASKFGTVGAVALDRFGNLAAGTSTGGMMNKQFNRIGDSPIIGAGTYADNLSCAVSCTGHGEYFMRINVAKEISAQMEFGGKSLGEAVRFTVHERLTEMGGSGGVIALDKDGNMVLDFNTAGMYRGFTNGITSTINIYGAD